LNAAHGRFFERVCVLGAIQRQVVEPSSLLGGHVASLLLLYFQPAPVRDDSTLRGIRTIRRFSSKTVVSNSTFDRGSLSPTYVKPFDVLAKGSESGDWLAALDDFRNWLIREAA
jgi:hypothetical protein